MKKQKTPQKYLNIYIAINTAVLLPAFFIILFRWEAVGRLLLVPLLLPLGLYSLLGVFVQYIILIGVLIYAVYRLVKDRKVPIFIMTLVLIAVNLVVNIYLMKMFFIMAMQ